jgi:putative ABC transport system substrate-binding protein
MIGCPPWPPIWSVRKVDVIVSTGGIAGALAAKNATATIPIVFIAGDDPVEHGLVASLTRAGGNLTGVSLFTVELMPKRFELLCEHAPEAKGVALLVNPTNATAQRVTRVVGEAARAKGVELHVLKAGTESEIDATFAALQVGPLVIGTDPFFFSQPATRGAGGTPCRSGDL